MDSPYAVTLCMNIGVNTNSKFVRRDYLKLVSSPPTALAVSGHDRDSRLAPHAAPRFRIALMDSRSILLVEDNADDVVLTLRALQKNGLTHEVIVARDGAEALHYLRGTGPYAGRDANVLPALVLLDLKLPRITGLELLKSLHDDTRLQQLRVVVLTSSKEDEDVLRTYRYGASSHIRKPIDFNDFLKVVGQLGKYWLELNEPPRN